MGTSKSNKSVFGNMVKKSVITTPKTPVGVNIIGRKGLFKNPKKNINIKGK
ncbi:MAG: hypothetical protein LBT96_05415 [Campylobacteraceae bacterium]|jgi:hypothetical protein|nr:hypothetical protein [Campylobacteraceae bacterium]